MNPIGVRMAILQKMTPPWVCTYPSDIVSLARYDIASLYLQQPENANPPTPPKSAKNPRCFYCFTHFVSYHCIGEVRLSSLVLI